MECPLRAGIFCGRGHNTVHETHHERTAAGLALAAALLPAAAQEPRLNLPRVELSAGMHQIDAQVARYARSSERSA